MRFRKNRVRFKKIPLSKSKDYYVFHPITPFFWGNDNNILNLVLFVHIPFAK